MRRVKESWYRILLVLLSILSISLLAADPLMDYLERQAGAGDPEAMFLMGRCFERGDRVERTTRPP